MIADLLSMMFDYNHRVVKMNTAGLTHADSLVSPERGGNCINWILGHILATRAGVHRLLDDDDPVLTPAEAAPYERGTVPLGADDERVLPLERLLAELARSQERLAARLGAMTDEELATPAETALPGVRRRGEALGVLQFHEAYHAGQIGMLRRVVGKEGAIR